MPTIPDQRMFGDLHADLELCMAYGAALPVDLPRVCPKCHRAHTSDALFCQACGTRLVEA
jgi:hypothetical protein